MPSSRHTTTPRRDFLTQLGLAAGAMAGSASLTPLLAAPSPARPSESSASWDMSWVDKIASAQYKIVIDANIIDDGIAIDHAAMILDHYNEVYETGDEKTRVVVVMRQLGTPMAFNDSVWERYPVGEDTKMNDPVTKAPIRRNPFWRAAAGTSTQAVATKLEHLTERGVIVLLCNIAMTNWSRRMAGTTQKSPEEVKADAARNLISGVVLVPSGIFALARAQNAGCAFLRGS